MLKQSSVVALPSAYCNVDFDVRVAWKLLVGWAGQGSCENWDIHKRCCISRSREQVKLLGHVHSHFINTVFFPPMCKYKYKWMFMLYWQYNGLSHHYDIRVVDISLPFQHICVLEFNELFVWDKQLKVSVLHLWHHCRFQNRSPYLFLFITYIGF